MAAEISEKLGVQPELAKGTDGVFDVVAGGALVFSTDLEGGFPDAREIVQALREMPKFSTNHGSTELPRR